MNAGEGEDRKWEEDDDSLNKEGKNIMEKKKLHSESGGNPSWEGGKEGCCEGKKKTLSLQSTGG